MYVLEFTLRQPCEILLCSKGFAFILQGQPADHEIAPIAIGAKFNVYGLIMANFIILCILKVYNHKQVQNQVKPGFLCFPYLNQKSCLRNGLHTDVYDILHQYLNKQIFADCGLPARTYRSVRAGRLLTNYL